MYLNDRIVQRREAVVSVFDHGFLYGDGVYETMRAYDDVVFMLDEHINRLQSSASMIGLALPMDTGRMKAAIYDILGANSLKNAYVRLTVSRGYGPIGLDPSLCQVPTFVILAEEMKDYPRSFYDKGVRAIISRVRRTPSVAINPRIKSLNFLNNILAKIDAKDVGAYEAIMLNMASHIAEGTISNVFFVRDGIVCTPDTGCGILDGITRNIVLKLARKEGMMVMEGEFTTDDIYAATEVFVTNTTMEVMPIRQIDAVLYEVGNVGKFLRGLYREDVRAYVKNIKDHGPSIWEHE